MANPKKPTATSEVAEDKEKEMEDMILKAVEAKAAEILKQAEAQAQEIIEKALEQSQAPNKAVPKEVAKANAEMEEYVTVKLFKDNGKYKDDVFVAVNGEGCTIPRGIPVKIKKKFAAVLDQSDFQDYQTVQFMDAESERFERETKARNL